MEQTHVSQFFYMNMVSLPLCTGVFFGNKKTPQYFVCFQGPCLRVMPSWMFFSLMVSNLRSSVHVPPLLRPWLWPFAGTTCYQINHWNHFVLKLKTFFFVCISKLQYCHLVVTSCLAFSLPFLLFLQARCERSSFTSKGHIVHGWVESRGDQGEHRGQELCSHCSGCGTYHAWRLANALDFS